MDWPAVFCRTCAARPGEPCVTSTGNVAYKPHGQRHDRTAPARRDPVTGAVRVQVKRRARGICEFVADTGFRCPDRGAHVHHVKRLSQGGSSEPANLCLLCGWHHRWVHDNPDAARALGLLAEKGTAA